MSTAMSTTSIVELDLADERSWWAREKDGILAALVDHYGGDVDGGDLAPPRDPAALRARLREVAPRLAAITAAYAGPSTTIRPPGC
jgi:hypothetical protein